jgi:hypothetical protein
MGQQKGKGKGGNKGGGKMRPPRSLEPLLQNPRYLTELAETRGKRRGSTALDEQVPRIIRDLCDPMVAVDMSKYGPYLIQEPVYTRLCQMLNYLFMVNHQYDIALTDYLSGINTPVQLPYQVPNQQYATPSDLQNLGQGFDGSGVNITIQQYGENQPFAQQVPRRVMMDHYTDIEMMKAQLNLARANEEVYGGALTALVNCHDAYYTYGVFNPLPISLFINQNTENARFISAPDMTGAEYYEKKKILDRPPRRENNRDDRRERRNYNERRSGQDPN